MALNWTRVRFTLFGGVDTKVDDVVLSPPKVQVAENLYADKTGQVRKRKGTTALSGSELDGDLITPTPGALARYRDSVLMFDTPSTGPSSWEYSATAGRWLPRGKTCPGRVRSVGVTKASDKAGIYIADVAYANGYTLYAHSEIAANATDVSVRVTIEDASGTKLCERLPIWTDSGGVVETVFMRCVARANLIYVFFYDPTAADLMVWILDTTSASTINTAIGNSGASPAAAVSVATDINTTTPHFDVASNSTYGIFVAYLTTTASTIKFGFVSTSGALASTSTYLASADATSIGVAVETSGLALHGIAFTVGTTPNDVYALHRSWNGSAWSSTASVGPIDTGLSAVVGYASCRYDSSTVLRIWATGDVVVGTVATDTATTKVYQYTATTGGTGTPRVYTLRRSQMASKPFAGADGALYFWVLVGRGSNSIYQPTHFLIESETGRPVAWANQGIAGDVLWLSNTTNPSTGVYGTALYYATRIVNGGFAFWNGENIGVRGVFWHQTHDQQFAMVEAGDSAYLTGGYLHQYDGVSWVEAGFLRYVNTELVDLVKANSTGSLTNSATYYYHVIPEWTDSRGKRQQGTDSGIVSVTMGAADDTVTVEIPTIQATLKGRSTDVFLIGSRPNLVFAVYRTEANPASEDAPFYRVGEVENSLFNDTVSFVDTVADVDLVDNEQLYLSSGELDHTAPPSGHIIAQGGGRVYLAGLTDDPNQIRYSLRRGTDDPLSFADELVIQCPEFGGDITGLAVMNESLVIFKERAIYRVRGEGPNNLGGGAQFLEPELVSSDTGCTGQRSIIASPMGLMFKADKGLYLLNQGYGLEYIGAPLEGLTVGTINGAVLLPMDQQVRFTEASTVWVFDYYHRVWSKYTQQVIAGPSVEYNGNHTWCGSSGVFYEDAAQKFTAADWRLKLAPLRFTDEMRVRYVGVTGTVTGTANLRIKLYKDRSSSSGQTISDSSISAGPYQSLNRVAKGMQICEFMTVEVDDNATGSGGAVAINEVVFDVGPRGMARRGGQ